MNELLGSLQLLALKPVLTALLLPPVPMLLAIVIGALLLPRQRRLGWLVIGSAVAALWLASTSGAALALARLAGLHPSALPADRIAEIAARPPEPDGSRLAIVVLGGGRERLAPEYGASSLSDASLQRLRYGVWLARRIDAPLAFSGGRGWTQAPGDSEAAIAARVAAEEFGTPLRWQEDLSRDTRDNARLTLEMLRRDGVRSVLLVTNGWHMRRSLRAFRNHAGEIVIEPAPMGLTYNPDHGVLRWLPSPDGGMRFQQVLREALGLLAGA